MKMKSKTWFILYLFFSLTFQVAGLRAEEVIYVPPVYHAVWDRLNPQVGYENADGATPKEACEAVLAQNPQGLEGYTYSHYMDDWVGRRCAVRSPFNPDFYSRIWVYYPVYRCPEKSSFSAPLEGCVCDNGFFAEGQACTPPQISINGPSSTQSLPSMVGPVTQRISILHNGSGKKSMPFTLQIQESGSTAISTISGVTNENGVSDFRYVPPYFDKTTVILTAMCPTCANTATKTIDVFGVEPEPQMCRR